MIQQVVKNKKFKIEVAETVSPLANNHWQKSLKRNKQSLQTTHQLIK